ncbi:MAG: NAD(P)-dependent oxidoreductase [Candidatus Omnitrophica bacterium]|nr:NAD(P)-dependent oxidoreductase [Candidatus Omnitrophota bacterium]
MNILIAGATGFIGKNLVEELAKENKYNLFCLVRNLKKAKVLEPYGAKLIHGDITDKASLDKILNYKIDIIFHNAAYVDSKNPNLLYKTNVLGSKNICELALSLGVEKVIYTSSVAVVSGNPQVPLIEELPFKATNIYGQSKIEAEEVVLKYRKKGLKIVIVRPPMVYGEAEPHMMKILLFITKYRLFPLIDKGEARFHLGYVKNVASAMVFLLNKEEAAEGSFFLGDEEVLTAREVFDTFSKVLGVKLLPSLPSWLKPVVISLPFIGRKLSFFAKDRVYSLERIKLLGFKAPFKARESLAKSAQSFLPH